MHHNAETGLTECQMSKAGSDDFKQDLRQLSTRPDSRNRTGGVWGRRYERWRGGEEGARSRAVKTRKEIVHFGRSWPESRNEAPRAWRKAVLGKI